jgi:hemerythrin-like domain-containing protein
MAVHQTRVRSLIAGLTDEHRGIEAGLDRLAETLGSGHLDTGLFRDIRKMNTEHYLREAALLTELQAHEPALTAKLKAQHDEASEIAARLEDSLVAGEIGEVRYLARRFLAIAQHNMIEEERDVFPLAERCFGPEQREP